MMYYVGITRVWDQFINSWLDKNDDVRSHLIGAEMLQGGNKVLMVFAKNMETMWLLFQKPRFAGFKDMMEIYSKDVLSRPEAEEVDRVFRNIITNTTYRG